MFKDAKVVIELEDEDEDEIEVRFEELLGVIFQGIEVNIVRDGINDNYWDDNIIFISSTGDRYKLYHDQECSESVYLADICGDVDDLLNTPILLAEVVTNRDRDKDWNSLTYTFYKLSTIKGSVTIRWNGISNGSYSETAQLVKL